MNPSKPFAQPSVKPIIPLKPSGLHAWGFIVLIGLLMLALIDFLIFFPAVLYFIYDHFVNHFGKHRVKVLALQSQGLWALNGGSEYRLLAASSVRRFWAILYFKPAKGPWWKRTRIVAVFPDSVGKEEFRKLRVLLNNRY